MILLALFIFASTEKLVITSSRGEGLFSSFIGVLNNLMWAAKNGKKPVVHWGSECLYFQPEGYYGAKDPWEYYFEPVSPLKYEFGDELHDWYMAPDGSSIWNSFFQNISEFHEKTRFTAKQAIDASIKIRPEILEKVQRFYAEKMAGKINIGIHLRGTDRQTGLRAGAMEQALIATAKKIAAAIDNEQMLSRNSDEKSLLRKISPEQEKVPQYQFFIATDEERLLEYAQAELPCQTISHNSHRSLDGFPVHIPIAKAMHSRAELGEEVLIEALLLAKCDFFVHTLSSVAIAVLLFNPSLKSEYLNPIGWLAFPPTPTKRSPFYAIPPR